ncbi:vWA domain-containing protein [Labrys okinawensis]|uniref:vWA domain-containing protein n=1 Tax=Labrys okinawensis TaxID=346911 RepID=UPI0039BD4010
MSVDHDFDSVELPEAPPSEAAREQAIFRAVTQFEESRHRQGGELLQPRRVSFGSLLPRPSLRLALATGAAVLIAVPMGVESMKTLRRAQTVQEEVAPKTDQKISVNNGTPKVLPAARQQLARVEPLPEPAGHREQQKQSAANAPAAPTPHPVQQAAEIVPAPAPPPPVAVSSITIPAPAGSAATTSLPAKSYTDTAQAPDESRYTVGAVTLLSEKPVQRATPSEIGRDKFANAPENTFKAVAQEPVSTFSIDVDTASYSYVRAALNQNVLPQPNAVRTEEMINYFPYDYAAPKSAAEPFSTAVTVMPNPWVSGHKLMRIGIKGYALPAEERPPANLVFLIDTSGSMDEPNKLPLLLKSLGMLVDTLRPEDKVAIVAYAGSAGVVLPPTKASDKAMIEAALDRLNAGGSTAGGEGLRLAYKLAEANFDARAVNRVMLSTDGDFNVGITNPEELKGFVTRERDKGIFLSVLGFGMGNLNDAMMQELAQNGNGEAAYIDTLSEARKVLVDQATSTLFPIAKDVKIQVEFNPAAVSDYRLVGYETRMLKTEDFNNDKVDAGEVGSGTSVTAIYDFVPAGGPRPVDDSRYQPQVAAASSGKADEYAFLKIRYKLPKSEKSKLMTTPVTRGGEAETMSQAPLDARFAVAVASFGEWLRGGKYSGSLTPDDIVTLANGAKGEDPFGYRAEFVNLVRAAKTAKGLPPSGQ